MHAKSGRILALVSSICVFTTCAALPAQEADLPGMPAWKPELAVRQNDSSSTRSLKQSSLPPVSSSLSSTSKLGTPASVSIDSTSKIHQPTSISYSSTRTETKTEAPATTTVVVTHRLSSQQYTTNNPSTSRDRPSTSTEYTVSTPSTSIVTDTSTWPTTTPTTTPTSITDSKTTKPVDTSSVFVTTSTTHKNKVVATKTHIVPVPASSNRAEHQTKTKANPQLQTGNSAVDSKIAFSSWSMGIWALAIGLM